MPDDAVLTAPKMRKPATPMQPVIDPAAWNGEELARSNDWKFELTAAEIAEIDAAIESVEARGLEIKDIKRKDFRLPTLDAKLADMKAEIMDGHGLAVLKGLPVDRYDTRRAAIAYWGIARRIGRQVSQNFMGHLLGHVYDLVGADRGASPTYRAYHTSAELGFHSDSSDVVVLLCMQQAKTGGGNRLASTVAIYNEMLKRRPDLVEELVKPWYRDRREEIPPGKDPYWQLPVFNFADGYFSAFWSNYYIRSAQRFTELPRFTEKQIEALDMMDTLADELCIDVTLEEGDIAFLHNHVAIHARNRYEDWPEPDRKRHLMRFWLETPEGRPIPSAVADRYGALDPGQRHSGIVVENMEVCTPLEPE